MTQLGTSLTFSISVRDIKTLDVIASDQKQYTLENVWDNSVGIPAQLNDMASAISRGISTEHNRRQQEIKDQLAREEAEKRAQLEREEETQALVNNWESGQHPRTVYPGLVSREIGSQTFVSIQFNANGTFSETREWRNNSWSDRNNSGYNLFEGTSYYGTYTRDGNTLKLTWTGNTSSTRVEDSPRGGIQTKESTRSSSGSGTYTITFSRDNNRKITGLSLSGPSPFGEGYRLR